MVRKTLILPVLLALAGCQSDRAAEAYARAAEARALAERGVILPETMDAACTAKMKRPPPLNKVRGVAWSVRDKQWQAYADQRDRQAANCPEWYDELRHGLALAAKEMGKT